jgi:hypothetical protein
VFTRKVKKLAVKLKASYAQEDIKAAKEEAPQVVEKLRAMQLTKAG